MNGPGKILLEAAELVCKSRHKAYGTYWVHFWRVATFWSIYKGVKFTAADVAMMMALVKMARNTTGEKKRDNFVDMAGYVALAGALREREE